MILTIQPISGNISPQRLLKFLTEDLSTSQKKESTKEQIIYGLTDQIIKIQEEIITNKMKKIVNMMKTTTMINMKKKITMIINRKKNITTLHLKNSITIKITKCIPMIKIMKYITMINMMKNGPLMNKKTIMIRSKKKE